MCNYSKHYAVDNINIRAISDKMVLILVASKVAQRFLCLHAKLCGDEVIRDYFN